MLADSSFGWRGGKEGKVSRFFVVTVAREERGKGRKEDVFLFDLYSQHRKKAGERSPLHTSERDLNKEGEKRSLFGKRKGKKGSGP